MKKVLIGSILLLVFIGAVVWDVFQKPAVPEPPQKAPVIPYTPQPSTKPESPQSVETPPKTNVSETPAGEAISEYPKITTEVVNGRTERTIHMGVRKWVWEPSTLRAKQGELVRLVIHNADVNHPLYIPELGIEAEVPPEGAVVEFEAKKRGSFFFLCGTYCGVGHAEMQGTLIIE